MRLPGQLGKAGLVAALMGAVAAQPPLGLDAHIPAPKTNPLTREKVELGRALFYWTGLSRDSSLACAGCHRPEKSYTDGRAVAQGIGGREGSRRTPPIFNRAWGRSFFWDGRAATLEEQVVQPIADPREMNFSLEEAVLRIRANRPLNELFEAAYGRAAGRQELAGALASFVRTILAGASAYDRFVAGDRGALTAEEQQGLKVFRGKGNCVTCHVGPNLTDESFHNTGIGWNGNTWTDRGRVQLTNDEADTGAFKTPSLREVSRTAPYMHNGSLATLAEVIEYYDRGGRENPMLDGEIRPLRLSAEEKRALAAFLRTLSGTIREGWPYSR